MTNTTQDYDIASIRRLLLDAFVDENDLRRFCRDSPEFRPVLELVSEGVGLQVHVDKLIRYCQTQLLFTELLAAVQARTPRVYERFEPMLRHRPAAPPRTGRTGATRTSLAETLYQVGTQPASVIRHPVVLLLAGAILVTFTVFMTLWIQNSIRGSHDQPETPVSTAQAMIHTVVVTATPTSTPSLQMAETVQTSAPTSAPTSTTPLETPASGPSLTMTESIASATTMPIPTPTPSPGTPAPSPTAGAVVAMVTTKNDTELQVSEFRLRFEDDLNGFPIQSGVEVKWDYIDTVEIGDLEDSVETPVTITLVNAELLETLLGWKRRESSYKTRIIGQSNLGAFDIDVRNLRTIDYKGLDPETYIPDSPPASEEGPAATVITKDGTSVPITGLHFFCTVYCSYRRVSKTIPLDTGLNLDLTGVKEIKFGEYDFFIPVTVTFADGSSPIEDTMGRGWRVAGFATLGDFDLIIREVATVILGE